MSELRASGIQVRTGAAHGSDGRSWDYVSAEGELELVYGELFRLFRSDLSNAVLQQLLGFSEMEGGCCEVEGTVMWVAQINTWTATVLICLTKNKERGGHLQKLYENLYGSILTISIKQIIDSVCGFVEYFVPENLQVAGP